MLQSPLTGLPDTVRPPEAGKAFPETSHPLSGLEVPRPSFRALEAFRLQQLPQACRYSQSFSNQALWALQLKSFFQPLKASEFWKGSGQKGLQGATMKRHVSRVSRMPSLSPRTQCFQA